ncbi:helix-turn-helix domain-containing protein [Mesorhizobium sp. M0296]
MDQAVLARNASVSRNTVVDFEKGRRMPNPNNLAAMRAALETAGVIFVDKNGDGPGVRLRKDVYEAEVAARAGAALRALKRE